MSDENGSKIFKGVLASASPESEGMGEMMQPNVPDNIRCLVISFDITNGNCQLAGPVKDKALCYMLLELARDIVKDHNQQNVVLTAPQK